jgi:RNA polymerase sigma factor (sigma-70 family)
VWDPRQPCGCQPTTRLRSGQVTRPVKLRWRVGFGTTPPVATCSCGSGSSLPTWGSPTGWRRATGQVAGPQWRTSPKPLGPLIAAVDRYQPGRRGGFVPFAVACVVGELKRYLRDTSWRVHVPRPLMERTLQLCRADDELQQALGRLPSTMELADHLQLTVEEVLEGLGAVRSRREISLDQPGGGGGGGGAPAGAGPRPPRPRTQGRAGGPPHPDQVDRRAAGAGAHRRRAAVLPGAQPVHHAARIGYSQMHVSRLLRRALERLRSQLLEEPEGPGRAG